LDCIIVGAGPAGIAAGRRLKEQGLSIKILEAEDQVGGRTRSTLHNGIIFDYGAAFLASFYTETLQMAKAAGVALVTPQLHPGKAGHSHSLLIKNHLFPHDIGTPAGFLRFPFIPFAQKVRTILHVARIVVGTRINVADPQTLSFRDEEDGRKWGNRILGPEAYEYVVRLAFEPFFFYGAEETSSAFIEALIRHSLRWRLLAPEYGMGTLCQSLAANLPVTLKAKVIAVFEDYGSLNIRHTKGIDQCKTVILAVPPPALKLLMLPIHILDMEYLEAIQFVPVVRANLGFNRNGVLPSPAITPAGPGRHAIAGCSLLSHWIPSRVPEGIEVVRVSAMGWRSEDLLDLSPDCIVGELLSDCRKAGIEMPEPIWTKTMVERTAIVKTPPAHFRKTLQLFEPYGPGIFFAGDWISGSTIEGAVRTGIRAADTVNRFLINRYPNYSFRRVSAR
jgi:protoporphyrinogen oxidase